MNRLSQIDLYKMQALGRTFASVNDQAALEKAVEFVLIAKDDEKDALRFWFEEGIRNVPGIWQSRVDYCMTEFLIAIDVEGD